MIDEQDGSRKVLAELALEHAELQKSADLAMHLIDAQIKESREDHACKLDTLRDLFEAVESKSLQEHDKWPVEREQ